MLRRYEAGKWDHYKGEAGLRGQGSHSDMEEKNQTHWSSHVAQRVMNTANIHNDVGLIPGLAQWVKDPSLLQAVT